jgi:MoaA/NifB/PqqE/SkfB family radical SAM enzyme
MRFLYHSSSALGRHTPFIPVHRTGFSGVILNKGKRRDMKDREIHLRKKNLSAFKNFLKTKFERLAGEVRVHSYPYYAFIDPSSICHLSCPTCPTGLENASKRTGQRIEYRSRTLMSMELFNWLIDELGEYLFMISFFNWGEPLMNKELPHFIKKAQAIDIYTEIHTNLSLRLSDQAIEDLLLSGVDDIGVSIDGFSKETYAIYRRGGNLDLVLNNLERLKSLNDRLGLSTKIIWNFLVFSFNEHEVKTARKYCENLGIFFNPRDAYIDIEKNPDWVPSYRRGEPKKKAGKPFSPKKTGRSCAWHYYYSVVNSDGSVSPCCALWDQSTDFGTVLPGTRCFADIWNDSLFMKARSLFSSKESANFSEIETICEKCPFEELKDLIFIDHQVRSRFGEIFSGVEPFTEECFRLLDHKEEFLNFYQGIFKGGIPKFCTDNYSTREVFSPFLINLLQRWARGLFRQILRWRRFIISG